MAHDVFISYANQDKKAADVLCAALESRHIRCWIAPRDVLPGRGYGAQILQAIEASKLLVLVFSGNANASQHVTREIERAVNKSVLILPFRIENVAPSADLEYFISTTQWLDAIEPPLEQYLDLLANAVRSNIGQPVVDVLPEAGDDVLAHGLKEEAEARRRADAIREHAERETQSKAQREATQTGQHQEREQRERDEADRQERDSATAAQRPDPQSPNLSKGRGNTPASAVPMTNYLRPFLMIGIPLVIILGLYGIFGGSNKPLPEPPVASAPEAPRPEEKPELAAKEAESGIVVDGKRNGQGTLTFPNGDKYVGAFKDDKFNGKGTFTFANGISYLGEFKDGKRNGQGTFTFPSGDKYVGAFKDDEFNGKGTFTFANGISYLGEFKDGKRNGQGTFTFPNGDKYVGAFKDDKFNGKGTFTYANGEQYVGEFRNDKRNGQGTFYRADGTVHSTGIWENDVLIR